MTTREAIDAAMAYVKGEAVHLPAYCGAYLSGSVLERGMDDGWPEDSDVDIVLLFDGALPEKIGKIRRDSVLLEITCMQKERFSDRESVLATHYMAYALNGGMVLDDPQGFLMPLSRQVQAAFWKEESLKLRAGTTVEIAYWHIVSMTTRQTPEDTFMSCGFGPSAIALPILAAAGRNCTVRKRLMKAREVLQAYGFGGFASRLEAALGCEGMTAQALLPHMDALERTYYRAMDTQGPSADYPFRSDIRPEAKAVAIDGTREMLMGAHPADAVFWMIATFARCMIVLRMDDPAAYEECLPDMLAFASALGVGNTDDTARRREMAHGILDQAAEIAEKIAAMAAK